MILAMHALYTVQWTSLLLAHVRIHSQKTYGKYRVYFQLSLLGELEIPNDRKKY